MKLQSPCLCIGFAILLMLNEKHFIECYQRLLTRKLTSSEINGQNINDIREWLTASLNGNNEPVAPIKNEKRETSIDRNDKSSMDIALVDDSNNAAADSKEASIYEDEVDDEDDGSERGQVDDDDEANHTLRKKSMSAKDVAKREIRNEDNYEDDFEVDSENVDSSDETDTKVNEVGSSNLEDDEVKSIVASPREVSDLELTDLDYEKEIEDQIQRRIDSIKDDIKRQIERKQQAREIEANNAKFDQLEFSQNEDEVEQASPLFDSPKSDDKTSLLNARSKRRSSDPDKVNQGETNEAKSAARPMKKRSYVKASTLTGKKRDTGKRKDRSSIIIPEQGRAEVRDDLPGDLTLDPKLRVARSYETQREPQASRSIRSLDESTDEREDGRWRRDRRDEVEDNDISEESNDFLFDKRDISGGRRGRSRGRNRSRSLVRKDPRRLRRHRDIRESPEEEEENPTEERNKRAMPLDENAALEYKESFGGFPSESGSVLGRFKRIKRSAKIS